MKFLIQILFILFIIQVINGFTTTYYEDKECKKLKFFEVKMVGETCFNYLNTNREKYICDSKTITHGSYYGGDKDCTGLGQNTTFGKKKKK